MAEQIRSGTVSGHVVLFQAIAGQFRYGHPVNLTAPTMLGFLAGVCDGPLISNPS